MSDEVKAAAERRRAYLAACQNQTILTEANPYIGSGWRIEMDYITLADAYLAQHDPGAVTISPSDLAEAAKLVRSTALAYKALAECTDDRSAFNFPPDIKSKHAAEAIRYAELAARLEGKQ